MTTVTSQQDVPAGSGPRPIGLRDALKHPLQSTIELLYERYKDDHEGEVATYIPELGRANPDWFSIAIATTDGHVYQVGNWDQTFSIQSISKPFVYGLALDDHGLEYVSKYVGIEPSGEAFNSISLDPLTGRPLNPMINAGAIGSTGLVRASSADERLDRICKMFGRFVGHPVEIDESIYKSESSTGFRNIAIANLLRNSDMIQGEPEPIVDVYFKQCSILTTCRDLSVMAATLANEGVCPLTEEVAIDPTCVRNVLSVMSTCGMYDFAGEWIFRVGMPAKSGVAGGVIGVLPGQFGVAVFSPRLDPKGNSVRGIRVFNDLASMLGLHIFNRPGQRRTFVRSRYHAGRVASKRMRPLQQRLLLSEKGETIGIWDLQGYLPVYGVELVIRDIVDRSEGMKYVIIDLRRVTNIATAAIGMLALFAKEASACGVHVIFTHASDQPGLIEAIDQITDLDRQLVRCMADTDQAIEWCEDEVLSDAIDPMAIKAAPFERFDIVRDMSAEQLATLRSLLVEGDAEDGETIIAQGDPADGIYFLIEGQASVVIASGDGRAIRVATCSPIMTFGEMALLDEGRRSASVLADGHCHYLVLTLEKFHQLETEHPAVAIKLLQNLATGLSDKLRRANTQISVLSK